MNRLVLLCAVALGGVFALSAAAPAQSPGEDHLPANCMLAIDWAGFDAVEPGTAWPSRGAAADAMAALPATVSQLFHLADEPDLAAFWDATAPRLTPLWRCPTRLYVGPAPPFQLPMFALICDAGDDAEAMAQWCGELLKGWPPLSTFRAEAKDGVFAVTSLNLGRSEREALGLRPSDEPPETLASRDGFSDLSSRFESSPTLRAHFDVSQALAFAKHYATALGPDAVDQIDAALAHLGLEGVTSLSAMAGFDRGAWTTRARVHAPSPRRGIFTWFGDETNSLASVVPTETPCAATWSFDVARAWQDLRELPVVAGLLSAEERDAAIQQAPASMGLQLDLDAFFAAFGDDWMLCVEPDAGGPELVGAVLTHAPRDAAVVEQGLRAVVDAAQVFASQQVFPGGIPELLQSLAHGEHTLHAVMLPWLSPCFASHDDHLLFGITPPVLAGVLDVRSGRAANTAHRTGVTAHYDLPSRAPDVYGSILCIPAIPTGLSHLVGVSSVTAPLPPLKTFMEGVTPITMKAFSDGRGVEWEIREPMPAATLLCLGAESSLSSGAGAPIALYVAAMIYIRMAFADIGVWEEEIILDAAIEVEPAAVEEGEGGGR